MRLFHSFPRPRRQGGTGPAAPSVEKSDATAAVVLASILRFGFICTPEWLRIYPHPATQNPAKQRLLAAEKPEYSHSQSRMCFTLGDETDLFSPRMPGQTTGPATKRAQVSHADLFGPFTLGLEVRDARRIGILPTAYYSPVDAQGNRYDSTFAEPGLHLQLIQRLKELREMMTLHAIIERSLNVDGGRLPAEDMLRALDIDIPFQHELVEAAYALPDLQRRKIFELFDTDRETALSLISSIDMMLSMFQETDSLDGTPLAFYQQREWRLIHHMRKGMVWYCLGDQPEFRNPLAKRKAREIVQLRETLSNVATNPRDASYFTSCWVLEEVDGRPLRDFISRLVVPARCLSTTTKLVESWRCGAHVVAAEDFGYSAT